MITADQARQQLRGLNKKEIAPIPVHLLKSLPPIHIFNVGKKSWTVPLGSWGTFTIQGREEGERYSTPLVIEGMKAEGICTDMRKIEHRFEDGMVVAKDIIGVGAFKDKSQDLTRFGVFIAAGPVPTEAELEAADEQVRAYHIRLVQEGDKFHAQGPLEVGNITAEHREAVGALNQVRDWARSPKQMANCPGCGEPVQPGTAVHGGQYGCGAILDHEKALALGLIQPQEPKQEKQKRA